jgi:hypothetical protein
MVEIRRYRGPIETVERLQARFTIASLVRIFTMNLPASLFAALGVVIGLAVIVIASRYLIRLVARSRLFDVALAADCELKFQESGKVVLHLEGPARIRHRPRLELALFDPLTGSAVPLKSTLPSRISGGKRARFSMARFEVKHRGAFRLSVGRLEKIRDVASWRVLMARPTGFALPVSILAIVAGSLMLMFGILSIVLPGTSW